MRESPNFQPREVTVESRLPTDNEYGLFGNMQTEEDTVVSTFEETDTSVNHMITLPDSFNDTVGKSLKIENVKAQNTIEVLGEFLGIADYQRNLASFWFLDTLALQMLQFNDSLDDYSRVIFLSWLVGEMKLIRDKKLSRDKFFDEMEILFAVASRKLSRTEEIPHWDLITFGTAKMESEMEEEEQESLLRERNDSSISKDSELKTSLPPTKQSDDEPVISTLPESFQSKDSKASKALLDVIIRATYDMYAGEVRYALVYAVFVEPIKIQVHNLPFTFRKPCPARLADAVDIKNFNLRLREALQKVEKVDPKKIPPDKRKQRNRLKETIKEYPPEPPSSLLEDNFLLAKENFLLPLIEANEATTVFDLHQAAP